MADTTSVTQNDVRYYQLTNASQADTVYPVIFNKNTGNIIWDGQQDAKAANYAVGPGGRPLTVDITQITTPPTNQTDVYFGASIKGINEPLSDTSKVFTYVPGSVKTAYGHFASNTEFYVDAPLVTAGAAEPDLKALSSILFQNNSPAVAKILVSLAQLISPEI